jgi:surfactin synthase thioesterase subunit
MRPVEDSAWVRRFDPSPAPRRLVCFPHAGGAATAFAPLARAVSERADVDVLAVQYPGRQERLAEPCLDSVAALTAAIVPEVAGWLDRPFALFGHSMGAIVAFEVARALEQRDGPRPAVLFVSARRAPSTHRDERVHLGGDGALLRDVTRLAGTPAELMADEDVRQMLLPALRGDYKAIETYRWAPGPPLRCPIRALVGDADPLTTEAEAAAWARHTTAGFDLRVLPGAHFYLADHVGAVADLVAGTLVAV